MLKLIHFDAAVEFGGFAGAKTSTGVCPPELFDKDPPHPVRKDLPAAASFDVWSFGVVLYTMLAGDSLFRVNRDDNIQPLELKNLVGWSQMQLGIVMSQSGIRSRHAKALLKKLLHCDPAKRPTMLVVLDHDFFSLWDVRDVAEDIKEILANTVELQKLTRATKAQLEDTQKVLLHGMFEATEVKIPTSIVILDHRLPDNDGEKMMAAEDRILDLVEGAAAKAEAGLAWFTKVAGFFKHPAKSMKKAFADSDFGSQFKAKEHYLYFVDEVTGKPVGGKPLVITTTSDMGKKLLPYMKFGLKAMRIANGVASIARVFIPAGVPKIPESTMENAQKAVAHVDKGSSVAGFDQLGALVMGDGDGHSKKSADDMRGRSLREFETFLDAKDPGKIFGGLSRVVWEGGNDDPARECRQHKPHHPDAKREAQAAGARRARSRVVASPWSESDI